MIESIYNSQVHGSTSSVLVKIPKNVRQVGQVNDTKKIYVEDYVMSFIKKLGMRKESSSELVVLLGQFVKINNCQCIFINGAIELKGVIYEDNLVFTNEIWTEIYETIKKYFTNVEIVGWSIIRAGLPLNVDERIRKVHVDNFAGQDKTLLLYDSLEREEAFYVFEENKLTRQDGYYIFYDKNAEMQNYIITLREEHETAKPYAVPRKNKILPHDITENEKGVHKKINPKKPVLVYGLGAVAAVVMLVFSASLLNGYENKSYRQKDSQDALSENVKVDDAQGILATQDTGLPIETAKGTLSTINNDELKEGGTKKVKGSDVPDTKKDDKDNIVQKKDKKESQGKTEKEQKNEKNNNAKPASKANNYYTVKEGDSLSSISMRLYHTRSYVKKIKELNEIEDSNKIKVGQKLLLP